MSAFLAYIQRLLVILFGFISAAIAASLFFVMIGILPLGNGFHSSAIDTALDLAGTVLILCVAVASFASMLLAIPVFLLAILAEYFKWNGFLFHGLIGAIIGFSTAGLWHASRTVDGESHLVLVGAAAGIVGACIYWLIAGRNAGKLFEKIIASRQQ